MALREKVAQIARGKENSTVINVSNIPLKSPETGEVQILRVMGLLWLSCPFDLYWYEEQSGFYFDYSYSGSSLNLTIKMPVSQDYRKGQYEIDENKKVVALKALQNAIKIADEATGSDYDKIMYFKNKICELVKYDTASNNDQIKGKIKAGNNPWQMVSVFDNNTATNVVCAGYSKAFKYLCDRAGIECKVVNGVCGGAHIWNDLYLPSMRSEALKAVVAIDTSGSMANDLAKFFAELVSLMKSFGRYELTVIQCDAKIQKVEKFSDAVPLTPDHRWEVFGRGGTDFRPVFGYVKTLAEHPEVLIFLTDGFGSAPNEPPPYPVLWVLTSDGTRPAGWGKSVSFK